MSSRIAVVLAAELCLALADTVLDEGEPASNLRIFWILLLGTL